VKLVIAIIRPYHLDLLQSALNRQGIDVTSVSEVLSGSTDPGYTLIYRDRQITARRPKCRVEFLVDDRSADSVVETVRSATKAGCPDNVSDAKVMVLQLQETEAGRAQSITRLNGKHLVNC